jgi:hypothetical protein
MALTSVAGKPAATLANGDLSIIKRYAGMGTLAERQSRRPRFAILTLLHSVEFGCHAVTIA